VGAFALAHDDVGIGSAKVDYHVNTATVISLAAGASCQVSGLLRDDPRQEVFASECPTPVVTAASPTSRALTGVARRRWDPLREARPREEQVGSTGELGK
jgi:hypothetical protein